MFRVVYLQKARTNLMGCTTFLTEIKPIEIQKDKKIALETNLAIDRVIFDNKLEYILGLTEDGIVFEESYKKESRKPRPLAARMIAFLRIISLCVSSKKKRCSLKSNDHWLQ